MARGRREHAAGCVATRKGNRPRLTGLPGLAMLPLMEDERFTTLVEARTVLLHLEDPTWVLLDCRYDLLAPQAGSDAYLSAHLPGAQFVDLLTDLSGSPTGRNGRHPLPSQPALADLFSRCGVDASRQVVVYDAAGGMYAARAWWLLRYLGHAAAALMDGGYPAWTEQGFPVRGGRESRPGATFLPRPLPEAWIPAERIAEVGRLLDARAPERYRGEEELIDPVAGHIPGAWSYPWGTSLDSVGRFLPVPELARTPVPGARWRIAWQYRGLLRVWRLGLPRSTRHGPRWMGWRPIVSRLVVRMVRRSRASRGARA